MPVFFLRDLAFLLFTRAAVASVGEREQLRLLLRYFSWLLFPTLLDLMMVLGTPMTARALGRGGGLTQKHQ